MAPILILVYALIGGLIPLVAAIVMAALAETPGPHPPLTRSNPRTILELWWALEFRISEAPVEPPGILASR